MSKRRITIHRNGSVALWGKPTLWHVRKVARNHWVIVNPWGNARYPMHFGGNLREYLDEHTDEELAWRPLSTAIA